MNIGINYEQKLREWIKYFSRCMGSHHLHHIYTFIFPRPMDKAALLHALVDYCLGSEVILLRGRPTAKGEPHIFQFVPDDVLAKIDPDSKDTFLKLQRLRRKHFIQRLRRVEVDGVSGVRMSLNWKLIYERLSTEYDKILARRKVYEQRREESEAEKAA
ncbi:hypothetical protein [Cerasicoccus frondis]|uniref:hypothetical protein n=1 Tax=Cerasicoccus frondis TaxID=490090 RepID=UPI002852A2D9|nr:hypothetical protein [Cerasicoccus frondis]